MYDFFLHSPLFTAFLMIGIAFSAIYINHGIWYIKDRRIKSSEASMDAYDYFTDHELENERTAAADERNHFLQNHAAECRGTVTMFAQWQDDNGQMQYDEVTACTVCLKAQEEEGYSAVVMPEQPIDLRAYVLHKAMQDRTKQVFAQIPVHRASAA